MHNNGYDAYGVDFAAETVAKINEAVPELKISKGDLKKLDYDDCIFDGYWALGVVEHDFYGYDSIMDEMYRVIKKGGYLFLTVPSMSVIRKVKAAMGIYPNIENKDLLEDQFYQFAFSSQSIIKDFTGKGFMLITHKPISGLKGLKDEIEIIHKPLQLLYDSNMFLVRLAKKVIDIAVRKIANHMSFYIFVKK